MGHSQIDNTQVQTPELWDLSIFVLHKQISELSPYRDA